MNVTKVRMGNNGRVVIPAEYRKKLSLEPGTDLLLRVEGDELRLMTTASAIKRAQNLVRTYVPEGYSLVDELIAERRAEAMHE